MNILVTGGLGYIGSHTCIKLIEAGFTPIIIDNLYNSKQAVLSRIEQITHIRPQFYLGDIRDKKLLTQIFTTHNISAVIHFAGLKAVGESVRKPLDYYNTNVSGSVCLLEVMKTHQVKNFIFSSSATVYGVQDSPAYHEEMNIGQATSPYGWSKLMVEQVLKDLQQAETDWSITSLRYFNPVGAHKSGLMGEDPQGIPNNLMPYISQVAVGKHPFVSIYGNDYPTPDGTGVRDYIHVEDLATGHVAALKKINQSGLHIYNLGSGKGYSVLEVIDAYSQVCPKPIPYKIVGRRAGDLAQYWADATKAAKELNWQTQHSLKEMVEDNYRWQSQNPNGYPNDE
ncbi:UDP-glucose 4-epimerase GalE [Zophobihabitans entericus]|uniref:UDP-glucose 4-epimerase n=1 Tax=Zophobihabitans entericus TaxID=1635327 RepID=A0A6G9IBB7_9GAMM|nr:UDP-glucose 4-epimerase GalE [Zophobihabitans entericus]QIQ21122.1 UDP-glucose 4-epimerase GalE [Zophobihabitans entericus]